MSWLGTCVEGHKAEPALHCARQLDEDTEGEVIYVADTFNAETGVLLTDKLLIGKEIAGGAQVSLCALLRCTACAASALPVMPAYTCEL